MIMQKTSENLEFSKSLFKLFSLSINDNFQIISWNYLIMPLHGYAIDLLLRGIDRSGLEYATGSAVRSARRRACTENRCREMQVFR